MAKTPPTQPTAHGTQTIAAPTVRLRFRVPQLFYMTTLVAAGVAAFGWGGLLPAAVVLGVWCYLFSRPAYSGDLVAALTGVIIGALLCCVGLKAALAPRALVTQSKKHIACSNHLRQLHAAIRQYYFDFGAFPPRVIRDAQGKPIHSWRVLLLPYLPDGAFIYQAYRFDEPWNGPRNRRLHKERVEAFQCPADTENTGGATAYLAVTDSDGDWLAKRPPRTPRQIQPGMSEPFRRQVLLVEARQPRIHWMEPRDVSLAEARDLLIEQPTAHRHLMQSREFVFQNRGGANVLTDYGPEFVESGGKPEAVEAFLRGDPQQRTRPATTSTSVWRRAKWGNVGRLFVFVLVCFLPLRWVRPRL